MNDKKTTFVVVQMISQFFMEVFVGTAIGFFFGRLIDRQLFEDQLLFALLFGFAGLVSAFLHLVRRTMKMIGGDAGEEKKSNHD